ncbi:MAG: GNAT family protein [Pseudomonadota bacterium]
MLFTRGTLRIDTERLVLRPPQHRDYLQWVSLRDINRDFLAQWDPVWAADHLSRKSFTNRVYWAQRSVAGSTAYPMLLIRRSDQVLLGAITLDNIRRGPAQAGTFGYWMGQAHTRQGYMQEAIAALSHYAFTKLDLSRLEAACLPENTASRSLLESSGFKYEGVAQSYLQIAGRWRTHVLYARLRDDRRGPTGAGGV